MLWLYIRRRRRHAAAAAAAALERQSVPYTPTKGQAQAQARDMTHAHKGSADIQPGPTSPSLDESPGRNVFQDEKKKKRTQPKQRAFD
ncbi:hypothetical protein CH063_09790 [Colletotrichum higginsianum]|uniref:Uncharacterized protein n=1 Tax=Colletotrichum higginsianum (strain IMI 349063) TaxID=759273 RepID=H1VEY2_COLHI|nr:hypothetical protein CH063_09790 [Colletotrichum higginsianum]